MNSSIRVETLAEVSDHIAARCAGPRDLVALIGAPGAGKSTAAASIAEHLPSCAVLPMDGFHFDDGLLIAEGTRARKGAPHTFDVGGLKHIQQRLLRADEDDVVVPVFDRSIEVSRAGARRIAKDVNIVLVEGNYLLLKEAGWRDLRADYALTIAIEVPEDELRRRLMERWQDLSGEELRAKMEENDMPNARRVMSESAPADIIWVQTPT